MKKERKHTLDRETDQEDDQEKIKNDTSYTEKNFSASRTHSFTGEETIPEMEFNQSKSVNYVFIALD